MASYQLPASSKADTAEELAAPYNPRTFAAMPTRNLGKTGYRVGIFSLGGHATIEKPDMEDESVAIVNRAIDLGVNYIDTAASYGGPDQWSQRYIGRVMKTRRKEVFLTSKAHLRTYDGAMRLLEGSPNQLNTDHLDLGQLHHITATDELDKVFAKDGPTTPWGKPGLKRWCASWALRVMPTPTFWLTACAGTSSIRFLWPSMPPTGII